ncbi:MAG: DUF2304 domain-containing protein [Oscillospiraceae bacterium]|nr:DUF2304 domain-containing protein [Oscillospiraceae bacterium]
MEASLRIFLAVGLVVYYAILYFMLKREAIILKYTLLWILSGLLLLLFLLFPEIVFRGSALIGVSNPVNAVFLLFAGFTVMLLLSLTSIVSQLSDRSRKLVQSVALLEERVRELEEKTAQNSTKN